MNQIPKEECVCGQPGTHQCPYLTAKHNHQIPNIEEETLIHFMQGMYGFGKTEDTDGGNVCMKESLEWFKNLQQTHHHQLQKARQDWLRKEIKLIKKRKYQNPKGHRAFAKNEAFNEIIDRYLSELDQEVSK